ncbi:hypothetical protein BMF94_2033 [Rhodotorula taiwanensis]|uniref:MYND-type domain-containing protein n=1 Tax=Rhodotorula taiwanensis TaxID=741276 RepID=A0A2S5BE66_9BASI|nr:hypothetical protein BMF94_2033 [Rhodotorula taiwanensis]
MRESNHSFPAHGRACICVSSGIYDRRALDAPTASLPLINSLTHLSYLTATSPRVREILAGDGGLERLVSILQQCAQGGAAAASAAGASASSSRLSGSLDRKGKGKAIDRPRPRRSPFKPFAEYSALPSMADIQVFEELGLPIGSTAPTTSYVDQPMPFALPPSLALPLPNKQRFLLHTYKLAFQCIVNIGVRGSEAIRTRVVEAGALDVVVYVLERYLEDVERRRLEASAEWRRQREITAAGAAFLAGEDAVMQVENDPLVPTFAVSSAAAGTTPTLALPPSTASLPLLTRVNVVAASSSSSSISPGLQPPSRVQTPDTVLSMDDSSVTGDENGSASGPDAEGDEVSMPSSSGSSSASTVAAPVPRCAIAERKVALADVDAGSDVEMRDQSRPESPAPGSSAQSTRRHARQALPRVRTAQTGLTASTLDSRAEFAASSAGSSPVSYDPAATAGTARDASNASGPLRFRDEDVLLSLQLLAYLSKYPHVRAIFHSSAVASLPLPPAHPCRSGPAGQQAMNVFSLVEAFTFKPASDDPFTPRHSSEVQYWAGVIMRNACRKDDARGGIRQCANMRCVKWEQYAREFAKCRRCRRAKYCSKVCQSEAWTQGHRYWCHKVASRRSDTVDVLSRSSAAADAHGSSAASTPTGASSGSEGLATPRAGEAAPSRRRHHSHHHHHHASSHGHTHQSARRRHRSAEEEEDDEDDLPLPPTIAVHDASTTPRAHPQRLPGGAPQFDLGPAEVGPTQTGLVPGVDEDHIAREMLRVAGGAGIGIGLGDNFDGVVRVQTN